MSNNNASEPKQLPLEEIMYPAPQDLSKEEILSNLKQIRKDITRTKQSIVRDFAEHIYPKPKSSENPEVSSENANTANNPNATVSSKSSEGKTAGDCSGSSEEKVQSPTDKSTETDWDKHKDIWKPPPHSIPIRADVRNFNFQKLVDAQVKLTGRKFDVIMTDPPWQLATSNPTRGVAIGYQQLGDSIIQDIPFPILQDNGFIFVWVINAKYRFALDLLETWGYTLVDEVVWVKTTVNRRLAKSHGFYLQHAKETCLVGRKGTGAMGVIGNKLQDVIFAGRRGQSQKPLEIYEMIEEFVPNGTYLEIFGRRNNLRNHWCTIGNEL